MGLARFETGDYPIVQIAWPVAIDREEFRDFERRFDALLAREEAFGVVLLIVGRNPPGADVRRAIADYQRSRSEPLSRHVAGFAIVAQSAVEYGVLTAIRWLVRPAYPERTFRLLGDAEAWVVAQLHAAGVTAKLPDSLTRVRAAARAK